MSIVVKYAFTLILVLFFSIFSHAQIEEPPSNKSFNLGIEMQVYPTGIIPGIRIEKFLNAYSSLHLRLGFQWIDHRDLGVHENEEGSGHGASLAYRRFFKPGQKGLSLALRTDLWFNTIDWSDGLIEGTSNITVVQPTLMGEYAIDVSPTVVITPSLSFGYEWNVTTDGEPTGEGAIILLGISLGFGM